jgi:hypothetical protein
LKNQISKINITFTNFTGDFSFNLKTAYWKLISYFLFISHKVIFVTN